WRHVALLRYQPALRVEVEDVERNAGVLHPVRLRLLATVDEQHPGAVLQPIATHQSARPLPVGGGDLDGVTLAGQLDPRAAACTGDGEQAGAGKDQGGERADAGHSGVLGRGLPARSDRRTRWSRRRVATDPFPNARIACTMRASLRSG